MEFFVDTADVAEIRELASLGLLDGVTTNPSLVAKAGRDFKTIIAEIAVLKARPSTSAVTFLTVWCISRGVSSLIGASSSPALCAATYLGARP